VTLLEEALLTPSKLPKLKTIELPVSNEAVRAASWKRVQTAAQARGVKVEWMRDWDDPKRTSGYS
jgi:hypothetical protein